MIQRQLNFTLSFEMDMITYPSPGLTGEKQLSPQPQGHRIEVVDALRGFAIVSIMLLHNIEHFDFYFFPDQLPAWIKQVDKIIWETLFFLFGGKSYAIFALLFGLTFFIQFNNRQKKGLDFSGRFLWRLILLLAFGIFNSLFFEGDILAFYAVIGIVLIPVRKVSDRIVFVIAVFLALQPVEWGKIFYILTHPEYVAPTKLSNAYFARMGEYLGGNSFLETVKGNLWNGRLGVIFWSHENGRFFQTASLFMLGMLLGRRGMFLPTPENKKFWKIALWVSLLSFIPLFIVRQSLPELIEREPLLERASLIAASWSNFAFMVFLVSLFVLVFQLKHGTRILGKLSPLGRMSLSNYVMQSILGSSIYYGYGLGLYQHTGASYSLLIGSGLAVLQILFSAWWMRNHRHGPLEYIWHKGTWI